MGRRFALLIGCDTYRDPGFQSLVTPVTDIQALAQLLRDPEVGGYDEVTLIPDDGRGATKREVEEALDQFFLDRDLDDLLFVYIGCHGTRAPTGELYFAMTDTNRQLLGATAIESRWLADRASRSRADSVVIFLDCCYSGSYQPRMPTDEWRAEISRDLEAASRQMLDNLRGEGRFVITACRATEPAYERTASVDGRPPRSVFVDAVISGIETGDADRDNDGLISADELYQYVYAYLQAQGSAQKPMRDSRGVGQIVVAWRRGRRLGTPRPARRKVHSSTPSMALLPQRGPGVPVRVVDVSLPRLDGQASEFVVVRWLRQVGEYVHHNTPLMEVAHKRQIHQVVAPATGVLRATTVAENGRVDRQAIVGVIVIGETVVPIPTQRRYQPDSTNGPMRTARVRLAELGRDVAGLIRVWWHEVGTWVTTGEAIGQAQVGRELIDIEATATGTICAIAVAQGESVLAHDTMAIIALP